LDNRLRLPLLVSACGLLISCAPKHETANVKTVRIQLKWSHQAQFAGFYAAQKEGYYAQSGLTARFIQGGSTLDGVSQVESGAADYAVISGPEYVVARMHKRPVVAIAVLDQTTPFGYLVLRGSRFKDTSSLRALNPANNHKWTIGVRPNQEETITYTLLLGSVKASINTVMAAPVTNDVTPFLKHKVDLWPVYGNNEPLRYPAHTVRFVALKRAEDPDGPFGEDYLQIYGDTLICRESLAGTPEARAVKDATIQGWKWALDPQNDAASLIPGIGGEELNVQRKMLAENLKYKCPNGRMQVLGTQDCKQWQKLRRRLLGSGFGVSGPPQVSPVIPTSAGPKPPAPPMPASPVIQRNPRDNAALTDN